MGGSCTNWHCGRPRCVVLQAIENEEEQAGVRFDTTSAVVGDSGGEYGAKCGDGICANEVAGDTDGVAQGARDLDLKLVPCAWKV